MNHIVQASFNLDSLWIFQEPDILDMSVNSVTIAKPAYLSFLQFDHSTECGLLDIDNTYLNTLFGLDVIKEM